MICYYKLILFVLFVLSLQVAISITTPFNNKFLKRFARINYDSLHAKHDRVKRSLDNHISFSFDAYDKKFNIKVKPSDKNYFATNTIEVDGESVELDPVSNYEGNLDDQPSYVFGSISDGYFVGVISTNAGKYYIEPAKRYSNTSDSQHHSIMYHESDVNLNAHLNDAKKEINKMLRNSNENDYFKEDASDSANLGCGLSDKKVKEKLDLEQESAKTVHPNEDLLYKYSREANQRRTKRQTGALSFPNDKSVCSLYLIADPFFYNQIYTSEGRNNAKMTLTYIQNYFNSYVASLNSVFNSIKFYTDSTQQSYYTGVQFKIFKTKVITFDQCTSPTSTLSDAEKKLCDSNLDTMTYLSNVALQNYNSFCLAYAFTARDFSNGALGLAYLASSNGAAGGLCQKNTDINGVKKSLNSGMVTLINYGSRVVDLITQISFLHEVGHSFGAQHDPASCQPGDSNGGNFIMYFSATTGTKPNNILFSTCSLNTMGPILNYVITNNFCFEKSTTNICGNGVIEANEACDCGFPDQCQDTCCNSTTCQLVSGAVCSPSQGLCCESDCKYSQTTKQCSTATDCALNAFCSGTSAVCPSVGSNSDLTACNGGTQVCRAGKCTGSICERYGLTQCYLTGDLTDSSVDKFKLCHLACTGVDTNNTCLDSFNITKIVKDLQTGIIMKPGSVCDNNLGYCDALSKCRQANHDSVINKLIASLLNPSKTLNDVKQWVMKYWWAILIFVIIFLVVFMFVIHILSKLLPTSNPNKNVRDEAKKKKKLEEASRVSGGRVEGRRRSQIFTTEISDNVDYERTVPKPTKPTKQRILV